MPGIVLLKPPQRLPTPWSAIATSSPAGPLAAKCFVLTATRPRTLQPRREPGRGRQRGKKLRQQQQQQQAPAPAFPGSVGSSLQASLSERGPQAASPCFPVTSGATRAERVATPGTKPGKFSGGAARSLEGRLAETVTWESQGRKQDSRRTMWGSYILGGCSCPVALGSGLL